MLKDTVWNRLLRLLDNHFSSEEKAMFDYICTHTQNILGGFHSFLSFDNENVEVWNQDQVTFSVEEFNMNYAERCLRKDNLERRLKGWMEKRYVNLLRITVSTTSCPKDNREGRRTNIP